MGFDSLFVGVSGLEAYQNQLDVISNNIANVSTTGYKEQNVNFEDLLYQASQYATAPTNNNGGVNGENYGLGVKVGSIDTNFSQGGMSTTGVNTNLAINGDGFFILSSPNATSAPVYTRNGDFSLNENGLLYDPSSGLAVQGWTANNGVITTGATGDITIPLGISEQAVGTGLNTAEKFGPTGDQVYDAQYSGNLDQTNWQSQLISSLNNPGSAPSSANVETVTTTLYDSLGAAHTATITYTPFTANSQAGTTAITANQPLQLIQSASGQSTFTGNLTVTVNAGGATATISDGTNTVTAVPGGTATLDGVKFTLGDFTAADAAAAGQVAVTTGSSVDTITNANLQENLITSVNGTTSTYNGNLTATVNGAGNLATISDGAGNSVTGASGSTVTIDGIQVQLGDFGAADGGGAGATMTSTAYESGLPSSVDNIDGTSENPATAWEVSVSFADGTTFDSISNPGATTTAGAPPVTTVNPPTYSVGTSGVIGFTYFNADGQYINSSSTVGAINQPSGSALTTANGGVHVAGQAATLAVGDQLNVESWGTGDNATAPTSGTPVTPSKATTGPIALSYGDMTSLATANSVTTLAQNGYTAGTLQNITIGQDGIVTGAFTNGQNQTLAQVAVASFQNEEGLAQIGSSQFTETANSGLAQIGQAASGQYGTINSGDLEQSNVDLASEFTKMIAAQNAYQANSKS